MKTKMKMFASLPLYIVTTLFAFGCVSALPRVHKQDPRNLPRVLKHDPRSGAALINPRSGKECPQFWEEFGGSCYEVKRSMTSLEEAEDKCKADNASVVKITTAQENNFVKDYLIAQYIEKAWIGMTKDFNWNDGKPVEYANWAPGHPNDEASCVWMDAKQEPEGLWHDVQCDLQISEGIGAVCEKPL
ncbi:PREDICTED: brevican core protein-like [Acropora digitifera]|uniref:brevican core protein-like n=1 Tax=Acropora digitifera TaxID=70779 RepID=UPI00077ADC03|nr:PREDICTED: brevican core protein-like [Acropora digitifera]